MVAACLFKILLSGDRRKAHTVLLFSGKVVREGVVVFFDLNRGFGRFFPFDGLGVAVNFNERVVDVSKGGASALRTLVRSEP